MKNSSLNFPAMIAGFMLIGLLISAGALAYPGGSPAGYTGSPGDTHHCTSCHGGSAATVTGWITSDIPASGYTAGMLYNITATVSGTGKKGMEVSPQNVAGAQLGVLGAGSNNHLVGGTKYVTQNSSGSTSSTVIYNFTWTAPAAGTGTVTFYGAFTVGKSNTKLSTLVVNENAVLPLAVVVTANPMTIIQGSTSQLNAAASGGTGTYSYSWTSAPAGFTSNLQNPVVAPTATMQYFVTVGDGSGTTQGNVTVTVNVPVPLSATASATPGTVCAGQTSQLNVIPAGGSGMYSYSWSSVPAGFSSSLPNPVVTPAVTTQYIASVSDGTQSAGANADVIVIQPATAAAGNDTTCAYITTHVPLYGVAASYLQVEWTTSGTGTFSAATSLSGNYLPSVADKDGGNVTLTLTATAVSPCDNAAVDSRIIHFDGPVGMDEAQNSLVKLVILPNPSHGQFTVRLNGFDREAMITIADITGKTLVNRTFSRGFADENFDLSGFPKGIYLVKVQAESQSVVRKLVVD